MANEFISKDGKIIVNCDLLEAYIPQSLFDDERDGNDIIHAAIASSFGDGFKLVGIFNIRFANGDDAEKKISSAPLKTFIYPNIIETYPSSTSDRKLSLGNNADVEDGETDEETGDNGAIPYRVLRYVRGDIMMDAFNKKDSDNCVKFIDLLNKGKIPSTVLYADVYNAWIRNIEINGANPEVPYMTLQFIIASLYKCSNDITKPFRFIYGKNMDRNDYYTTNIRGSVAGSSIFANQTFEHMNRMLTNAVNITRRDLPQEKSPIEKTLYY